MLDVAAWVCSYTKTSTTRPNVWLAIHFVGGVFIKTVNAHFMCAVWVRWASRIASCSNITKNHIYFMIVLIANIQYIHGRIGGRNLLLGSSVALPCLYRIWSSNLMKLRSTGNLKRIHKQVPW